MKKVKIRLMRTLYSAGLSMVFLGKSLPVSAEIIDEESPLKSVVIPTPSESKALPTKAPSKEVNPPKVPAKSPEAKPNKSPTPNKGASSKPASTAPKENLPVHFSSQGLKGLREKGLVELVQEVVVTQGEFKLEADNAQVYFSDQSREVQKVISVGQPVKITNIDPNSGDRIEASGNQVIFNNEERIVILEGNAKIKKGTNSTIKGKKITYELDSGWIKADRVAGEVSPSP